MSKPTTIKIDDIEYVRAVETRILGLRVTERTDFQYLWMVMKLCK